MSSSRLRTFPFRTLAVGLFIGVAASTIAATVRPQSAQAASPAAPTYVTITGQVTDHGKPAPGHMVAAWCGDGETFAGTDTTDANGNYRIPNFGRFCGLKERGYLAIYHPNPADGIVAYKYFFTHSTMVVNVRIEDRDTVDVPEFGAMAGLAAVTAGGGVIFWVRQRAGF